MESYRAFVTGATGFTGANIVRSLVKNGHDVHIITRKTSDKWRISDILHEINEHTVDIMDADRLKQLAKEIKPEVILHFANAGVYGGKHIPEKQQMEINFFGTINMINACNSIDYTCFINTGSSSEYGPKKTKMKETDICEPASAYGISKCVATLYAQYISKEQSKPIITFRLFSPYGPYDHPSRLISYAIKNTLLGNELRLASPNAARDYIFVDDVVELFLKAMNKPQQTNGEIFNVGSGSQTRIKDIIDNITTLTDSKSKILWNAEKPHPFDTTMWEADITKTSKTFGWKPNHGIKQGLKKTVEWFRNNLQYYN